MDFNEALQHVLDDKLLLTAIPFLLLSIIIEYWVDKHQETDVYEKNDLFASIAMGIFALIVEFIPKVLFFTIFLYIYQANLLGLNDFMHRGNWWAWVILLFADDFTYYWFHRMNHEVRFFWAGHVSHHSSTKFNFGTSVRQGVGERLHKYAFWLWLPFFGFDPVMLFIMMSINLIYQHWVHTEAVKELPRFYEAIFNTPSHHRVHHASQARYLDRNHGGLLIIWDKIFGSFSEEKDFDKPKYGLTSDIGSNNWIYVATHEYGAIWYDVRRANKFVDKLKYIFYSPGWSHDGPDLRAKTLRNQVKK
jgi:sterol desaturase/sphingolipid hydroxylase (fatty acid hydroxylase superfamily)